MVRFGKKKAQRPGIILKHEKKCFYNPESKSCATCQYLWQGYNDGKTNIEDLTNYDYCGLTKHYLYRLKTQCSGHKAYEGWPNRRHQES